MASYQPFVNPRREDSGDTSEPNKQLLTASTDYGFHNGGVNNYPPSVNTLYPPYDAASMVSSTTRVNPVDNSQMRATINRTPSPTPSEARELKSGAIDWKAVSSWKFWIRREWLWYYLIGIVLVVLTALMTLYHKQIVNWLTPATKWLHDLKFGWLVPIGVLFVISFPPLFGHEIVAILCGLVWGLWVGFGIVAAGTFLGEVGNFYAFKYCCRARGEKLEKTNISYSCLARVVRDGGFKIALIARLSAIPGHFTTAVFSACGMNIFVFCIAAALSMPKQFITVYLGVILEQSNTGVKDTKSRIISDVVLAITIVITVVAMWYILRAMNKVKPQIIYERRKARQAKLARGGVSPYMNAMNSESTVNSVDVFNPTTSDADIQLGKPGSSQPQYQYQQWDKEGRAVGYAGDPTLVVPQPQHAKPTFLQKYPRDEEEGAGNYNPPRYQHGREESTDVVEWDLAPTPTQRAFASDRHPLRSPLEDSDSGHSHGAHQLEPTDATYRTAYSSSPDAYQHPPTTNFPR